MDAFSISSDEPAEPPDIAAVLADALPEDAAEPDFNVALLDGMDDMDLIAEALPEAPGLDLDLDLLDQLGRRRQPARAAPQPTRYEKRSAHLMEHARAALDKKRSKVALNAEREQVAKKDAVLAKLASSFPHAATALGVRLPKGTPLTRRFLRRCADPDSRQNLTSDRAADLCRAAFLGGGTLVPRGLGVRHSHLVAFAADLVHTLQHEGMLQFLQKCAWWRWLHDPDHTHKVLLAYTHESDSTCQSIAQQAIQTVGRASKARLATEIIQQRGRLHASLMRLSKVSGDLVDEQNVCHEWQSSSMVVLSKTAPFLVEAYCILRLTATGQI
jgi:hypothetical protein